MYEVFGIAVGSDTASDYESETDPADRQQLHLVVANGIEPSVVYRYCRFTY